MSPSEIIGVCLLIAVCMICVFLFVRRQMNKEQAEMEEQLRKAEEMRNKFFEDRKRKIASQYQNVGQNSIGIQSGRSVNVVVPARKTSSTYTPTLGTTTAPVQTSSGPDLLTTALVADMLLSSHRKQEERRRDDSSSSSSYTPLFDTSTTDTSSNDDSKSSYSSSSSSSDSSYSSSYSSSSSDSSYSSSYDSGSSSSSSDSGW